MFHGAWPEPPKISGGTGQLGDRIETFVIKVHTTVQKANDGALVDCKQCAPIRFGFFSFFGTLVAALTGDRDNLNLWISLQLIIDDVFKKC